MGNIPVYQSRQQLAVNGPTVSPISGSSINQMSRYAVRLEERQREIDITASVKATMAFGEWETDYQYNPETGTLVADQFKRAGAKGLHDKYKTDAEARYREILEGLETEGQKQIFEQQYKSRLAAGIDRFAKYEAGQLNTDHKETMSAFAETEVKRAVGLYQEGRAAESNEALNMSVAYRMQSLRPASQPERDMAALKLRTAYHKEVFDGLVTDNPGAARKYLKENRKDIDPTVYNDLDDLGNDARAEQKARLKSDEILLNHREYKDQVSAIKDIKDPEVRARAERLIDQHKARMDRIERDQEEQILEDVYARAGTEGASLSPQEKRVLGPNGIELWNRTHARELSGVGTAFNYEADEKLVAMNGRELAELDLADFRRKNNLTHGQYQEWKSKVTAARSGDETARQKLEASQAKFQEGLKIGKEILRARGIGVSGKAGDKAKDAPKIERFNAAVRSYITGYFENEKTKGQYPSSEDLRKHAYGLLVSGTYGVETGLFEYDGRSDDLVNRVDVMGTKNEASFLPDLSVENHEVIANAIGAEARHITQIIEALNEAGQAATLANMRRVYNRAMGK